MSHKKVQKIRERGRERERERDRMYKWVPMFDIKSVFQSYIVKKEKESF